MRFNIGSLNIATLSERGSVIEIEHPITGDVIRDSDLNPLTWTLRGEDSPQVRAVIHQHQNKRSQNIQKGRGIDLDAETLEAQTIDKIVAATITFSDNWMYQGEDVSYSEASVRKMLVDPEMLWLVQQLNAALGDRKRFLPKKPKS